MKKAYKIAISTVCALAVAGAVTWVSLEWMLVWRPITVPGSVTVVIRGGMNATAVANLLKEQGLIRNVNYFIKVSLKNGYDRRFKEGIFQISGKLSATRMAYLITRKPEKPNVKVTIPEGLNILETASCVNGFAKIDSVEFVRLSADSTFIRSLGVDQPSLEGYLFPDTYYISDITTASGMVQRMVQNFNMVFVDSLRRRAEELGMSVHEAVTLASIVQMETPVSAELPMVSQVFHSRLENHMRLQANPTIQYILGEKRRVLTDDLDVVSPYNTYMNPGLPPGPIASPGRDAIMATLYPSDTEYLYFMADVNGGHVFSTTLQDHNKAVNNFRQIRGKTSVQ